MQDETQFLTAMNSGVQTVIPETVLASPQLVYLDFDGAKTSYRNEDLGISIPVFRIGTPIWENNEIGLVSISPLAIHSSLYLLVDE